MVTDATRLVTECGNFAGGMVEAGTECIVVLRKDDQDISKIDVISATPSGSPADLVEKISNLSGIPKLDIEIFVYVVIGGARGRDI